MNYALAAQTASDVIDHVLVHELGLQPPVAYGWTEKNGHVVLLAQLDPAELGRSITSYDRPATLRQLSQALASRLGNPVPVVLLDKTGLYYAARLTNANPLPQSVDFPGIQPGLLRLGVARRGEAVISWQRVNRTGHIMVSGTTGSGKSICLRSIVHQAIGSGFIVRLSDMDGRTFPMLSGHPSTDMPIASTDKAIAEMVELTLGECAHRSKLYDAMGGHPDDIEEYNRMAIKAGRPELRRILLVLDEFSSVITHAGGPKSDFSAKVEELGWRGRKFGIVLVFATQELTKDIIGCVRSQAALRIGFRIEDTPVLAALELKGAEHIKSSHPGRAMTTKWGIVQTYLVSKDILGKRKTRPLNDREQRLYDAAQANNGRLPRALIAEILGISDRPARAVQEELARLGWIEKHGGDDNSFCVTPKWTELASNRQPVQPCPTALFGVQPGVQPTN